LIVGEDEGIRGKDLNRFIDDSGLIDDFRFADFGVEKLVFSVT
jgi:hypothetical protein